MIRDTVAANLTRIREDRGMTQASLAARCGKVAARISELESGKRDVLTSTLEKLATGLDCDVRDLLEPVGL